MTVYISGVAQAPALAEEVTLLPLPSKDQLNKIVKFRKLEIITGTEISKVYICLQNSAGDYEWAQIAVST